MKKITFIILIAIPLFVSAQTQQGYVKTKGRLCNNGMVVAGQRLPGATVKVKDANPVVSSNKGTFSISVSGNSYYLQNVQKPGYVLTDPDVLTKQYAYSRNPLVLVMETSKDQAADELSVERKMRQTLQRQLQEKENEINSLKKQQKLTDEEYRQHLQELNNQRESNEKLISEIVGRYSKIDFDEVPELDRQIKKYVLEGKQAEVDSLLNIKGDINSRAEALRKHKESNSQGEKESSKKHKKQAKSKDEVLTELEILAQDCYSKFELFKLKHQNDSAAYYIQLRADLDISNIYWSNDAADFYATYFPETEDALRIYKRMLAISERKNGKQSGEVAYCNNNLGAYFESQGQYQQALGYFTAALNIYEQLGDRYPRAKTLCKVNIGSLYIDIDYSKAFDILTGEIDVQKELFGEQSDEIATLYNSIALCYKNQNEFQLAEDYYNKVKSIWSSFYGADSYHVDVVNNCLAGIMQNTGRYQEARKLYNDILAYRTNEFGENHPLVANIYNNMAFMFIKMSELDSAYTYQTRAIEIVKGVYGEKSSRVAELYGNIASILQEKKDWKGSLEYLQKSSDIFLETNGSESTPFREIMTNIDYTLALLAAKNDDKDAQLQREEFLRDKVYIAKVSLSDTSPAHKLGMAGEYYVLKLEDWDIEKNTSMLIVSEGLKGKPKTIVLMQSDSIIEHRFEDTIGVNYYIKIVSPEEKKHIIECYNNWVNRDKNPI